MNSQRKYPIGIQTFERIISEGNVYIDKTDLIWELARVSPFVFMSRPRRFGKSLLTTTLQAYFAGEKELFEGLKIMSLEQEWEKYPVLRIDLSLLKGKASAAELRRGLILQLAYSSDSDVFNDNRTPGEVLESIIRQANRQTGKKVVVLIDEYDAPLLDVLNDKELLEEFRRVMQEFYQPLKALEGIVKFCFITGITKFSQLSIFSTLNNLKNVTLSRQFAAICGITDEELTTFLADDIRLMAEEYGCSAEEMHDRLRLHYDGYHFAERSPGIYNPFSLLNALSDMKLSNYWFATGTPTFLIEQMQHFNTDITTLEAITLPESAFDQPTENMEDALPLLYQSGYLTIKDFDRESLLYTLAIPNQEVRTGLANGLVPAYLGIKARDVQAGFALKFWQALKQDDIDLALREMKAYFAGLPYIEGFKQKMGDVTKAEGFYEWTFFLVFTMLNVYAKTQVKTIKGRTDMVVWMPGAIYVMELKVNGSAQDALAQIDRQGYALPYQTDGRRVVKVGISFSTETLSIADWVIA